MNQRHAFLKWLITVKDEEVTSHENIHNCMVTVTTLLCVFSVMEVASYFIYAKLVRDEMMQSYLCMFSFVTDLCFSSIHG